MDFWEISGNVLLGIRNAISHIFKVLNWTLLFLTGNIDLINLVLRLTEIDVGDKINEEDLLYIEKEFNKVLFRNRYESFFNFKNLKKFLKLIIEENN